MKKADKIESEEEKIQNDFSERVKKAIAEIEAVQKKYEVRLIAEDLIGEYTRINLMIRFQDIKKHEATVAQDVKPIISPQEFIDDLNKPGDEI